MKSAVAASQSSPRFNRAPEGTLHTTHIAPRVGRVVAAIDGSKESGAVYASGIQIANALNAYLDVVSSWTYPALYGYADSDSYDSPEHKAIEILTAASSAAFHGRPPEWVTLLPREGRAADALIDASAGAEMLIVGRRGLGAMASLLLGSVGVECVERATCPVLIIH